MPTSDSAPTTADSWPAQSFDKVFLEELHCIKERRTLLHDPSEQGTNDADHFLDLTKIEYDDGSVNYQAVLDSDLSGISISGGGIRSATFGLGVLQGLAAAGLLPRFDYLSTVSGGGYIGGWLEAWIKRQGLVKVEEDLKVPRGTEVQTPDPANPGADVEAVKHLRRYSNYLAPRVGLLSLDSWVLIAIYLRNLLLNQLVILGLLLAFYLLARSLVETFTLSYAGPQVRSPLFIAVGALAVSAVIALMAFAVLGSPHERKTPLAAIAVTLLSCSAAVTSLYLANAANGWTIQWTTLGWLAAAMTFAHLLLSVGIVAGREVSRYFGNDPKLLWQTVPWHSMVSEIFWTVCAGALAGVTGAVMLIAGLLVLFMFRQYAVATFSVFGLPVLLLSFVLTNFLHVGLLGTILRRYDRERWSSLNARFLVIVLNWLAILGITVYGPWLVVWLTDRNWGKTIGAILGSGWVVTTLGGLWAGNSADTGKPAGAVKKLLAAVAPYVFIFGLALALCYASNYAIYEVNAAIFRDVPLSDPPAAHVAPMTAHTKATLSEPQPGDVRVEVQIIRADQPSTKPGAAPDSATNQRTFPHQKWRYLENLNQSYLDPPPKGYDSIAMRVLPLCCFCGAAVLAYFIAWILAQRIGLNAFTLHDLYAHRLIRCYLGASRHRDPDPLTNFDPYDDLLLADLVPARTPVVTRPTETFLGPYHLLNGALNRKGGRQHGNLQEQQAEALAFQDRKAESFIFSPLYCGSAATGYCRTEGFADSIKVGTAMAVSGAAVSSNMGYQSTPAMTFLLTLFNLRLGAWFGSPKNEKKRQTRNPPFSPLTYIGKEMLGNVAADTDYVYVSDGGHFENMGVYELIRRRCRFIVAIDTWADPDTRCENLGRLVRNVRVDFGIRIELDIEPTRIRPDQTCQQHFAFGRIHYGDVHRKDDFKALPLNDPRYHHEANQGILLYLKVGLTGDEPNDLKNYQAENPLFPHHPIDDQFFDEAQFESYRQLGTHTVEQLLEGKSITDRKAAAGTSREFKLYGKKNTVKEQIDQRTTFEIFDDLFNHWLTPPPHHHSEAYARHNEQYAQLMKELRSAKELQNLAEEFYGNGSNNDSAPTVAERLMVVEMMTLLENAWFGLELEKYQHYPQNAGWLHVFHAWATKPTAQKVWHEIELEFGPSFRAFIATLRTKQRP